MDIVRSTVKKVVGAFVRSHPRVVVEAYQDPTGALTLTVWNGEETRILKKVKLESDQVVDGYLFAWPQIEKFLGGN